MAKIVKDIVLRLGGGTTYYPVISRYISPLDYLNSQLTYYRVNDDRSITILGDSVRRVAFETLGKIEPIIGRVTSGGTLTLPIFRTHKMSQRPDTFTLNTASPLARGLVFAGLGMGRGSLKVRDSSFNRNHGTLTNMTPADWVWSPTLKRFAQQYDSTSFKYVSATLSVSKPMTLACWFSPSNSTQDCPIVSISTPGGTARRQLSWTPTISDREIQGVSLDSAGSFGSSYLDVTLGDYLDKWNHLACKYVSQTSRTLYVRGIPSFTDTTNIDDGSPSSLLIGSRIAFGVFGAYFSGGIADVCVWQRILSDLEIKALADPENIDIRVGNVPLILPPRRVLFLSSTVSSSQSIPSDSVRSITLENLSKTGSNFNLDIDWSSDSVLISVIRGLDLNLGWTQKSITDKISNLNYLNYLFTSKNISIEQLINIDKSGRLSIESLKQISSNQTVNMDWDSTAVYFATVKNLILDLDWGTKIINNHNINIEYVNKLNANKQLVSDWRQPSSTTFKLDVENLISLLKSGTLNLSSLAQIKPNEVINVDWDGGVLNQVSKLITLNLDYGVNISRDLTENIDFVQKLQSSLGTSINWLSNAYIIQDNQLSVEILSKALGVSQTLDIESLTKIVDRLKLDVDYDGTILILPVAKRIWILGSRSKTWILQCRGKQWILNN